jgi:FKBP-type peptidyl-prolyl cis-trans isomerase (trigger factor)
MIFHRFEASKACEYAVPMTREEIQKRMDELARKYVETHDRDIIEELNRLSRQLQELDKRADR